LSAVGRKRREAAIGAAGVEEGGWERGGVPSARRWRAYRPRLLRVANAVEDGAA